MPEDTQWVVLELNSKAENEDPDMVRASIRHHIRDAAVFVPASVVQRGDQRVFHYLMEGYAFVEHRHPEGHYTRLVDTKYVLGPLYVPTGNKKDKRLALVSLSEINHLQSQIKVEVDQGIEINDTVVITSGPYKNISAVVREEIPEHDSVVVHIQLRSTDRLVTLPRAFLRLKSKPLQVVYRSNFNSISSWAKMALTLVEWPSSGFEGIHNGFKNFTQWDRWLSQSRGVYFFIRAYQKQIDFGPILRKFNNFNQLCSGVTLQNQILVSNASLPDWSPVVSKYREVALLSNAYAKLSSLYWDVKNMTESTVNLVVDGTQLFIRCAYAPGLGTLTDSKGRPTGAIVGFLRSLGAYKKRFPKAHFYVCWDGSSQRRKAIYPEYKGNRVGRTGSAGDSFGIDWLRDALPLLGVSQAYNPKEEADDVIASLVRGPLQGSLNIIVSTDRDMLQLVSEFTHLLCPTVGLSKEKLYEPSLVTSEYGVPPTSIVHIRALSGDSSDNISGVTGFGLKTASKLIKLYGTISTLLASNLAGLSESQVTKLRQNEKRVRDNVELLTLRDVEFNQIKSNPDQMEVEARLKELEIKTDSLLDAFFPSDS